MTHRNQLGDGPEAARPTSPIKLLNIYSQPYEHGDARIVGNTEGLKALRDALNEALSLAGDKNSTSQTPDTDGVFASDGERYQVKVFCNNEHWGMKDGKFDNSSFWNDNSRSEPHYCDRGYKDVACQL